MKRIKPMLQTLRDNLFVSMVLVPVSIFGIYQVFFASPQYESQASLIVQQPDSVATMDAGMSLLTGLGVPAGNKDTELVKAFILSNDLFTQLDEKLNLSAHYRGSEFDYFSRLASDASKADKLAYFHDKVTVDIDEKSSIITVQARSFTPEMSHQLNIEISKKAEWYINNIGHELAKKQLSFIESEHENVIKKLSDAKSNVLAFQREYNLLDPEKEGSALSQIAFGLEAKIAEKKAEVKTLSAVMKNDSPAVMLLNHELDALTYQLNNERSRLINADNNTSLNEVLAKYSDLKIQLELALSSYTASSISHEKARVEAYRTLKYLVVVENATLPDDNQYPEVIYNTSLLALILFVLFGMTRIIVATIKELK